MNVAVAVAFLASLMLLFAILAGAAMGAVAGAVVGFVFDSTMDAMLLWLGLDVEPWQFGAMLGFVGSFFRPSSTLTTEKK